MFRQRAISPSERDDARRGAISPRFFAAQRWNTTAPRRCRRRRRRARRFRRRRRRRRRRRIRRRRRRPLALALLAPLEEDLSRPAPRTAQPPPAHLGRDAQVGGGAHVPQAEARAAARAAAARAWLPPARLGRARAGRVQRGQGGREQQGVRAARGTHARPTWRERSRRAEQECSTAVEVGVGSRARVEGEVARGAASPACSPRTSELVPSSKPKTTLHARSRFEPNTTHATASSRPRLLLLCAPSLL